MTWKRFDMMLSDLRKELDAIEERLTKVSQYL